MSRIAGLSEPSEAVGNDVSDRIPKGASPVRVAVGVSEGGDAISPASPVPGTPSAPATAAPPPPPRRRAVSPPLAPTLASHPSSTATPRAWVHAYRDLGLNPIPVCTGAGLGRCKFHISCNQIGKTPLVPWARWMYEKPSHRQIDDWWSRFPGANVGIVTGEASGVSVIDIERIGLPAIQNLTIPETPTLVTQSGGRHFWCKETPAIYSRPITLNGMHVGDLRGSGGFVVAPPSRGTAGTYEWIDGRSIWEIDLAEIPEDLIRELMKETQPAAAGGGRAAGGGAAARGAAGGGARERQMGLRHPTIPRIPPPRLTKPVGFASPTGSDSSDTDLGRLPERYRRLIVEGWIPGCGYPSRSEAIQSAAWALVFYGRKNDAAIKAILVENTIGQKIHEKGRHADKYVERSIAKARRLVGQQRAGRSR